MNPNKRSEPVQAPHGASPLPHPGGEPFTPKRPGKLLRLPATMEKTGLGRSSVYAGVRASTFPAPVRLSARAVGWREEDIDRWIIERTTTAGGNQ